MPSEVIAIIRGYCMNKFSALAFAAVLSVASVFGAESAVAGGTVSTDGSTSMEKVIGSLGEKFPSIFRGQQQVFCCF